MESMNFGVRKPVVRWLLVIFIFSNNLYSMIYAENKQNGKLNLGDPIPDVAVQDQNDKTVNLAQEAKAGYTLFFFYPRALTRGCTAQACSLRDAYTELQEKGVKIFGVSTDTVDKQKEFEAKNNLPYRLLADTEKKVIEAFGVPVRNKTSAARQAYLFKDGQLVWVDTSASTDKQAEDVLKVLDTL